MKKSLLLVVISAISISIFATGCLSRSPNSQPETSNPKVTSTQTISNNKTFKDFENKAFNIKFSYPADWSEPVEDKESTSFITMSTDKLQSINLVISKINSNKIDMEKYKKLIIEDISKNMNVDKKDIIVANSKFGMQDGIRTKYTTPQKMILFQDCTIKDGNEYILTYAGSESSFVESTAIQSFESFNFLK